MKLAYILNNHQTKLEQALHRDTGKMPKPVMTVNDVAAILESISKKHLVWITRQYIDGGFKLEDAERLKADITQFNRIRAKLENKDLNSYESLRDLYSAIESQENEDVRSKREKASQVKHEGASYVVNDPNFKIIQLITHEAACFYGAGTKWCTAGSSSKDTFDNYNKQGPIYVIMVNDGKTIRKFQLHVESDQLMDEVDQSVSSKDKKLLSSNTAWTTFLENLIEKQYGKYIPK